jgi:hypothetical protein
MAENRTPDGDMRRRLTEAIGRAIADTLNAGEVKYKFTM